ncbi:hypothetical protein BBBOND_0301380 [Babesia bigemina]|uniref:Uncharacterized protein n=1 Tax=Babesia bigemina TaxID=5866 RepID=A0A061DBF5_BABBI|nr:hypothetical protein BBBOND_0301380 [Babesia bigemina]CDR96234.1 hypothetical protein BBBOND_0301380 [Babesia bigemina]|eukprot:XP_012768420.1 hypothetical protein BBBOND_0301380 [Babesia bigemina]
MCNLAHNIKLHKSYVSQFLLFTASLILYWFALCSATRIKGQYETRNVLIQVANYNNISRVTENEVDSLRTFYKSILHSVELYKIPFGYKVEEFFLETKTAYNAERIDLLSINDSNTIDLDPKVDVKLILILYNVERRVYGGKNMFACENISDRIYLLHLAPRVELVGAKSQCQDVFRENSEELSDEDTKELTKSAGDEIETVESTSTNHKITGFKWHFVIVTVFTIIVTVVVIIFRFKGVKNLDSIKAVHNTLNAPFKVPTDRLWITEIPASDIVRFRTHIQEQQVQTNVQHVKSLGALSIWLQGVLRSIYTSKWLCLVAKRSGGPMQYMSLGLADIQDITSHFDTIELRVFLIFQNTDSEIIYSQLDFGQTDVGVSNIVGSRVYPLCIKPEIIALFASAFRFILLIIYILFDLKYDNVVGKIPRFFSANLNTKAAICSLSLIFVLEVTNVVTIFLLTFKYMPDAGRILLEGREFNVMVSLLVTASRLEVMSKIAIFLHAVVLVLCFVAFLPQYYFSFNKDGEVIRRPIVINLFAMSVVIYQYGILLVSWSIIGNQLFGHNVERLKNFFAGLRCNTILGFNRFPIYQYNKYHALYNDIAVMVFYNIGLTLIFAIYYYFSKVKRRKEVTIGTLQKLHDNFNVDIVASMDDIVRFKMFVKVVEKHKHYMVENAEIDHCKQFFERFEHHSIMRLNRGMQFISCLERIKKYALCAVFLRMKVRNMSLLIRNVQRRYREQNPHKQNKRGYLSLLKEKLQLTVEEIDEFRRSAEIAIAGKSITRPMKANKLNCDICNNVNCGGHSEKEYIKPGKYDLLELENFLIHQRPTPREDLLPEPCRDSKSTQSHTSSVHVTIPSCKDNVSLGTLSHGKSDEKRENVYSVPSRRESLKSHTTNTVSECSALTYVPLGAAPANDPVLEPNSAGGDTSHHYKGNSRSETHVIKGDGGPSGVQSHRNGATSSTSVAKPQNPQHVSVGAKQKNNEKLHLTEAMDIIHNNNNGDKGSISAECTSKSYDVITGASESDDKNSPPRDGQFTLKSIAETNIRANRVDASSNGKNDTTKMRRTSLNMHPCNSADDALMGSIPNRTQGKEESIATKHATNVLSDSIPNREAKGKMPLTKRSAHINKDKRTGIFKESIL